MSESPFQAPSPQFLAELLPQYNIDGFIAQGGMGAVYSGRQSSLDRDIAIKVLPRELGEDPEFRESFASEAKAMARLNHPNLISVFDYGDVDGMPYIVMEYVEGCSLHESAWNQAIDPEQAVAIVKGICDGLAHAHEHGIVHRDIKPPNILLTVKAEPKIGDFGLAQSSDSDTPGLIMGTPGYTAPEVFKDFSQAGPLADIYSVGVVFHQLLTGIDPSGSMEPPSHATGNIRLDAIWKKATHANPKQRYATVAEMGEALKKWQTNKSGIAIPSGPANFQPSHKPAQRPAASSAVPMGSSAGHGFAMFVKFIVAGALVAVIVFTYQLLQERKEEIKDGIAKVNGEDGKKPTGTLPIPEDLKNLDPLNDPDPTDDVNPAPLPDQDPDPDDIATIDIPPTNPDPTPDLIRVVDSPDIGTITTPDITPDHDPDPKPDTVLEPGDPDLRERAIGLIEDAREKREEEYAENANSLIIQIGVRARRSEPAEAAFLEQLKEDVVNNRVPNIAGVNNIPEDLKKLFYKAYVKEEEIQSSYKVGIDRIRDAYVSRLQGAADETLEKELKRRLQAQAMRAADSKEWVEMLSPEPEIKAKQSTGGIDYGFAGHWEVQTNNQTQWVADANGVVTINSGEWKGKTATWKILDDGTLEIHWPDKDKPYVMTRDGNGWRGKTSYGKDVHVKPGNW